MKGEVRRARKATPLYWRPPVEGRLDETSRLGSPLDPVLSTSDRGGYPDALGVDKRAVGMDAVAMTFEVVKTRESAFACGMRAQVRLGTCRVMGLDVGLRMSLANIHLGMKLAHLQIEGPCEPAAARIALVSLLRIVWRLAWDIATTASVRV